MKRLLAATATAALIVGLTACGGNSDKGSASASGSSGSASKELKTVVFGVAPVAPTGALQVGVDQGFFKNEGIKLDIQKVQGGAAVLPGVMAGNPQFATSNAITLLTARDKGLGIKIVSNWSSDKLPPEKGLYGVVAPKGSAVKTLKDLEGKKVAVNTLKGLGDFTVGEATRKAGGNPDKINFVELAFPDMTAALAGGSVDAVWVPEPFLDTLLGDGQHELVGYTTQQSVPGLASYVFTSEQLEKSDPALLKAMTRALEKTLVYADAHTDEVRAAAATITGLPLETLKATPMEAFGTDLGEKNLKTVAGLMQKRGWIKDGDAAVKGVLP